MSRRNKIIGVFVLLAVLVGGGYGLFLLLGANAQPVTATLAELAAKPGSWQCALSYTNSDVTSSGTVYITDGSLRGDFTFDIHPLGETVESHLILKGATLYTWNPDTKVGSETSYASSPNSEEAYQYRCEQKTVDASLLELPAGVAFVEQ